MLNVVTRCVPARPGKTGDEPGVNRVGYSREDNGNGARLLPWLPETPPDLADDHIRSVVNQPCCKPRQSIDLLSCPPIFDVMFSPST